MVDLGDNDKEYAVGDFLAPKKNAESNTLVLTKVESGAVDTEAMLWVVAQVYTMPDGQDGLKIQRVR